MAIGAIWGEIWNEDIWNNSIWAAVSAPTDLTPDAFTFTDVTGQELSTVVESNTITVLGVDSGEDVAVTITGGEYAVDSGAGFGGWTSAGTNVQLNYDIKVRGTTSASYSTQVDTTLTAGGVSDTFSTTTRAAIAPSWAQSTLSINVAEGSNTIPAAAAIGDDVTYTDGGTDAALITTNASTGVMTLSSGVFAAATKASYSYTRTASSIHGSDAVQTITLTVVGPSSGQQSIAIKIGIGI